jgi:hypothetical protein
MNLARGQSFSLSNGQLAGAEWIVILPGPSARMPNGSMEATMGEMDHRRALLRDELGR